MVCQGLPMAATNEALYPTPSTVRPCYGQARAVSLYVQLIFQDIPEPVSGQLFWCWMDHVKRHHLSLKVSSKERGEGRHLLGTGWFFVFCLQ